MSRPPAVSFDEFCRRLRRGPESFGALVSDLNAEGGLPVACAACGSTRTKRAAVSVDTRGFFAVVPLSVCPRCLSKPPFAARRTAAALVGGSAMAVACPLTALSGFVPVACLFGLGAYWLLTGRPDEPPLWTAKDRAKLSEWALRVPAYERLRERMPEAAFGPWTLAEGQSAPGPEDVGRWLVLKERLDDPVPAADGGNEASDGADLPPGVARMIAYRADRALRRHVAEHGPGVEMSVALNFAALPGRVLRCEVVTAGEALPRPEGLLRELESLPGWPVRRPTLFGSVTLLTDSPRGGLASLPGPFASWAATLCEEEGFDHAGKTAFDVVAAYAAARPAAAAHPRSGTTGPLTESDCAALREGLEADPTLAFAVAHLKRHYGFVDAALEDARSIDVSGDRNLALDRAALLGDLGRGEEFAAACRTLVDAEPDWPEARGLLAQAMAELGLGDAALQTIEAVPESQRDGRFDVLASRIEADRGNAEDALGNVERAVELDPDDVRARFQRGRMRLHVGDDAGAAEDLLRVVEADGPSAAATALLAEALRRGGRAEEGDRRYTDLVERSGGAAESLRMRGDYRQSCGRTESARADFDAALAADPDDAAARLMRSQLHRHEGRGEDALTDAEAAVGLCPRSTDALLTRALARAACGDAAGAEGDFDAAAAADPADVRVLFERGRFLAEAGRPAEAETDFTGVLEAAPGVTAARVERGLCRAGRGDRDGASADFEAAVTADPPEPQAWLHAGRLRLDAGDRRGAAEAFGEALRLRPGDPNVLLARSRMYLLEGDLDLAAWDVSRLLEGYPGEPLARGQRAWLRLERGDADGAIEDTAAFVRMAPEDPQARLRLVSAFDGAGRTAEADAALEAAGDLLGPVEAAAERPRRAAEAALRLGEYDRAAAYADRNLASDPGDAAAARQRAIALWYGGRLTEAAAAYGGLVGADDADADAGLRSAYGQVLAEAGRPEEAMAAFAAAWAAWPDGVPREYRAAFLSGRATAAAGLGRVEEALSDLDAATAANPASAWVAYRRAGVLETAGRDREAAVCYRLSLRLAGPPLPASLRRRAAEGAGREPADAT